MSMGWIAVIEREKDIEASENILTVFSEEFQADWLHGCMFYWTLEALLYGLMRSTELSGVEVMDQMCRAIEPWRGTCAVEPILRKLYSDPEFVRWTITSNWQRPARRLKRRAA